MELTDNEQFLLEVLREKDQQAVVESSARMTRFLTNVHARLVAEGSDIPLESLSLNPTTGELSDRRNAEVVMTLPCEAKLPVGETDDTMNVVKGGQT